jgi:histidinol-phosphate aminotransferase
MWVFVYICNPNNPTGRIVPKQDIKLLLDSIPQDIPVFVDEAYHHFVDDPNYEPSIKYVIEGRKVIVARTFSKIAGLAGMRLGYAVAPAEIIDLLRPFVVSYNTNAIVKHGGVAALKDTAYEAKIKQLNKRLRDKTMNDLKAMGYQTIPSQANIRRGLPILPPSCRTGDSPGTNTCAWSAAVQRRLSTFPKNCCCRRR